jgi:hypothetical protein
LLRLWSQQPQQPQQASLDKNFMKTKVSVYPIKTTLEKSQTRTETIDFSFQDGTTAHISTTERIESEQANPVFLVLATFFVFCTGTYCLIQTLKTSNNTYEIPSRREQPPMESTRGNLYYYRYR